MARTIPQLSPATHLAALAIAVISCAQLGAAELVVRDLTLELLLAPTDFDYELTDSLGTLNGTDTFDSNLGLGLGGRWSFAPAGKSHGVVLGVKGVYLQGKLASGGDITQYGLRAEPGYAWAITDHLTLTGLLELGYGKAKADTVSPQYPSFTATGKVTTYGLRIEGDYALTDSLVLGLGVGYQKNSEDLSGNHGITLKIDNDGVDAGLKFTWKFSTAPKSLE